MCNAFVSLLGLYLEKKCICSLEIHIQVCPLQLSSSSSIYLEWKLAHLWSLKYSKERTTVPYNMDESQQKFTWKGKRKLQTEKLPIPY